MRHCYSVFLVFSILLVGCTGPTAAVSSSGNGVSSTVTSSQPGSSSPGMSSQSTPSTVVLPSSTTPPSSTAVPSDYIPVPPDYFTNRHYWEDEDLKTSTVEWAPIPAQVDAFDGFEAYVAGTRLPLYSVQVNTEHVFYPNNYKRTAAAVGILRLVGRAFFQIRCPFPIESVSVKPVGAGISSTIDTVYNVLGFELTSAGQYTVEINGPTEHVLHLFVDGSADQYDDYKGAETIYFGPGLHDRSNDDRINANDEIILHSGQTLFIDYGAVVRAKIVSDHSTGVKVVGGGVIDGSLFDRDAEKILGLSRLISTFVLIFS